MTQTPTLVQPSAPAPTRVVERPTAPATDHPTPTGPLDGVGVTPLAPAPPTVKVSVVIPTLNEAANLSHVFAGLPRDIHELIIVDGRSTDGTVERAQELWPGVRIVLDERRGKGYALQSGFAAATGDVIVMLDADGSMDPGEIPAFVDALRRGADFAKGSRALPTGGSTDLTFIRKLGNGVLTRWVNLWFGTDYTDLCYGYNAFWRAHLDDLDVDCGGFEVETLMNIRAARAGLEIAEVPSFETDRIHGESNLNAWRDGWRIFVTIVRERVRRRRPAPVATVTEIEPVATRAAEAPPWAA